MDDLKATPTPEYDGLKDQAERVAASLEPLRATHLFHGEPPKLFTGMEPRVVTRPPPQAKAAENVVRPLVIFLVLIGAFIAAVFFANFILA